MNDAKSSLMESFFLPPSTTIPAFSKYISPKNIRLIFTSSTYYSSHNSIMENQKKHPIMQPWNILSLLSCMHIWSYDKKIHILSLPNHRINAYHLSYARKKYLMASFCLFSRETTAKQSAFKLRSLSRRPLPKARRAGRTSVKLQIRQYMTLFLHCIFFHVISVY